MTRAYFGSTVCIRRYASGSGRSTYKYNFRGAWERAMKCSQWGEKRDPRLAHASRFPAARREIARARRILTRARAPADVAKIGDGLLLFVLTRGSRCLRASNPETLQQARYGRGNNAIFAIPNIPRARFPSRGETKKTRIRTYILF